MKVILYQDPMRQARQADVKNSGKQGERMKPRTDATILKQQGISYKDILTGVKNVINQNDIKALLQGIRKTRDENLLMRLKKGEEKTTHLTEKMAEHFGKAQVKLKDSQKRENLSLEGYG